MDARPPLTEADKDKVRNKLRKHAYDKMGVRDFDVLFSFFEHKRFVQPNPRGGSSPTWALNTKFDDEWALNIFSEKIDLLATGIYKLDDVLKGGFRAYRKTTLKGDLEPISDGQKKIESLSVLLQGRPGSGKTTTALLMLCNFVCQGYSTLYISAEQQLSSLLRTIERFCDEFERDETQPEIIVCKLKAPPVSDSERELERQLENNDLRSFVKALRDKRQEIAPQVKDRGKFGIAVLEGTHDAASIASRLGTLRTEYGIHFIVLCRVAAKVEEGHVATAGTIFPTEPQQFLDQLKAFKSAYRIEPTWLVLDSVTAFERLGDRFASYVFQGAEEGLCRLFLTEHVSRREANPTDLETSCDMLVELGERNLQIAKVQDSPSNYMQRYLEIKKFRLSPFHRGKHPMALKNDKVKVFRSAAILLKVTGHKRREEEPIILNESGDVVPSERLRFGIDGLDTTYGLNGSMGPGSFTVLHGPPGSHKTAMCNYFLTSDIRQRRAELFEIERRKPLPRSGLRRKHFPLEAYQAKPGDDKTKDVGRCLIYSFTADRRSIIHGMRNFVDGNGPIFEDHWAQGTDKVPALIEIHDINPGYLFPEAFVEDLLDTLTKPNSRTISRIVFDSFDAIQAAYPIMRMDQFFWKVISQICCDHKVSALLKVSNTEARDDLNSETAVLLSGIADNIIAVNNEGNLKIVASEHRVHNTNALVVERAMVIQEGESARQQRVWLRVKA